MQQAELTAFFNGAFDMMKAAFTASEELSNASKGAVRERAPRQLLSSILPPALRIETGDIIDSRGNKSGQLDGIVVEDRGPALKLAADDSALVLAESAIAVLEIKSNLSKQWEQVVKKYAAVAALRPAVVKAPPIPATPGADSAVREKIQAIIDEQRRIPFVLIGYRGFADAEGLRAKVSQLPKEGRSPMVMAVSFEPLALVARSDKHGAKVITPADRGDAFATVWFLLVTEAQRIMRFRSYPWASYVGGPATPTLQGTSGIDFITQEPLDFDD